jgi:outer membrane lipoprotein LolB
LIPPARCRRALAFCAAFLLAGCGTLVPTRLAVDRSIEAYSLDGRFGLRDRGQSYQGRLQWQHGPGGDRVFVQDPFGGGVAELTENAQGARMVRASGEIDEAADAPQLMYALTGVALPVRSVARWLTGRALPATGVERDAVGRPRRFAADGWKIEYEYESAAAGDADLLPSRIMAVDGTGIELRLAIESWTLDVVQ